MEREHKEGQQRKVDLSAYTTGNFKRGAGRLREGLWLVVHLLLFRLCPFKLSAWKCAVLRAFGATIGRGVVIKPDVSITFPWKLTLGDHVWLGEECRLLNLAGITIGNHVCISQRAYLCTGNHDHSSPVFDLITAPIVIESGAWIGLGSTIAPGVRIGSHAVLQACALATRDLEAYGIYGGNPATLLRMRAIGENRPPDAGAQA